jgi:hypothetical protein
LVDEVISRRDKVVEELMGEKAVGEMDSREEDKGEGRTRGYFGFGEGKKIWEEESKKQFCLNNFVGRLSQGHNCCWEFWARGPGNHKDSWS